MKQTLKNSARLLLGTVILTSAFVTSEAEARDRVDRRQTRQNVRVQEGKQSGEITEGEAARLRHTKRVVRRSEKRAEADGVVTDAEKARLEKMQDTRSQQIHRLKHNDKTNETPSSEPAAPVAP